MAELVILKDETIQEALNLAQSFRDQLRDELILGTLRASDLKSQTTGIDLNDVTRGDFLERTRT